MRRREGSRLASSCIAPIESATAGQSSETNGQPYPCLTCVLPLTSQHAHQGQHHLDDCLQRRRTQAGRPHRQPRPAAGAEGPLGGQAAHVARIQRERPPGAPGLWGTGRGRGSQLSGSRQRAQQQVANAGLPSIRAKAARMLTAASTTAARVCPHWMQGDQGHPSSRQRSWRRLQRPAHQEEATGHHVAQPGAVGVAVAAIRQPLHAVVVPVSQCTGQRMAGCSRAQADRWLQARPGARPGRRRPGAHSDRSLVVGAVVVRRGAGGHAAHAAHAIHAGVCRGRVSDG